MVGCAVLSGFFCAVLGWPGAPKEGEKMSKNKLWETLLGAKVIKKLMENRSWRTLGRLLGALGGQEGPLRLKNAIVRLRVAT